MGMLAILFLYATLKFKYMHDKENWSLIQQHVMASEDDLSNP